MIKKESDKFVDSLYFEGMPSISSLIKGIESGTNNRRILKIFIDESRKKTKYKEIAFLKSKSTQLGFEIEFINEAFIDSVTIGNTHGGIIALCSDRILDSVKNVNFLTSGTYFLLEGIEDPYNFGYAIRSLYAAGIDGVIVGERNWMGAAGIVARSSAGSSEMMLIYTSDDIVDAVKLFKDNGYTVACAGIRDSVSLFDTELKRPLLVVLGGEKRGISRAILDLSDIVVRIDYGSEFGGSLSSSAAAAVFSFEILRQNRNYLKK